MSFRGKSFTRLILSNPLHHQRHSPYTSTKVNLNVMLLKGNAKGHNGPLKHFNEAKEVSLTSSTFDKPLRSLWGSSSYPTNKQHLCNWRGGKSCGGL